MDWLQSLDTALFRFINVKLANPVFDWLMPFLSWNQFFPPLALLGAILLACKGGRRGRLCVFFLVLVVAAGDGLIVNTIKKSVERPRPFKVIPDTHVPERIGKTESFSMPSGHSANWFAGAMVAFLFYRRSWRFMFPLAAAVGLSRICNGVHYPSDVLAGAILGAGYGALAVWLGNETWRAVGRRWFPLWWEQMPSVFNPDASFASKSSDESQSANGNQQSKIQQHWLRLGYIVIAVFFIARIAYLAAGRIELSEDEAYQWLWSKHLALSYYSKPPGIALAQWLGTHIWGDNEFGVRFVSPCVAALLGVLLLRFVAREADAKAGVLLLLAVAATPLLAVGSTLLTIDALSVLFWTAAMLSGWRALRDGATSDWLWTGLWLGCGFLSKAVAVFQIACFVVFFLVWKPARTQLRRPGPWLALLVLTLCALPVLVWNAQHGWATAHHLHDRAGLEGSWKFTLNFFQDFVLAEFALLNPVFFIGIIFACAAIFRESFVNATKEPSAADLTLPKTENSHALRLFLFSMGAPLFVGYLLWTLRARVQPNWIAPAVLPMLALAVLLWQSRWRDQSRQVRAWFAFGAVLGLVAVVFLHETNLVAKLTGKPVPSKLDPLTRVRGWRELANAVGLERDKLTTNGQPAFVIGGHYGVTSLLNFYMPGARERAARGELQAYYLSSEQAENQYYFWPGYRGRLTGANAIFVLPLKDDSSPAQPPASLLKEFASVTDLGVRRIERKGRLVHTVQLFACHGLKPVASATHQL
ncbi:MAG: glycosyltransferase family 39 protein [Verrucomicrobia bacterium]|nr:glycosyltransferase family 39 protein [Verrucomicrobiota bacterium]